MFKSKPALSPYAAPLRLCLAFIFFSIPLLGLSQPSYENERLASEAEITKPAKLNNRSFQKNLEKYADQLDLTSRQIRKINRIEKKYSRREAKLARRPSTKKKQLRALQREKRERIIAVLDYEQQHKLQQLSKSGFWDFLRAKN